MPELDTINCSRGGGECESEEEDDFLQGFVPVTATHNGETVNLWWVYGHREGDPNGGDNDDDGVLCGQHVGGIYRICDNCTMCQKALGHNRYAEEKTPIPHGAICQSLSSYQRNHFCRDPVPEPDFHGMGLELEAWVDAVKEQCLTITDVLTLEPGQEIKVLHMDRNLGDTVCEQPGNQLFTAEEFFAKSTAVYKHESGLKGTIKYSWQESEENPYPFEFDIEYAKDCWYPLEDGYLPTNDPQGFSNFHYDAPKPYTDFPQNTRVGWRGPMLLWNVVCQQPDVYWYNSNYESDSD